MKFILNIWNKIKAKRAAIKHYEALLNAAKEPKETVDNSLGRPINLDDNVTIHSELKRNFKEAQDECDYEKIDL